MLISRKSLICSSTWIIWVWIARFAEARSALEYSPILGNQKLLEQIAAHLDRLKPVFVITPADFYETGTLDWLKVQAAAGNRAFRVDPLKSRSPAAPD